ncbi:MAG TPA: M23 family metallopeptidase [Verrucomicrobiae bacterium]|nr:M23 family metallopeptidase [Verrucomicrobiae bacterium]
MDRVRRVITSAVAVCLFSSAAQGGEQKLIKISSEKKADQTEFYIENLQHADVTVTIEMELKNLVSSENVPYTSTVAPRAKVKMFSVSPKDAKEDSSWSYTYYATWGNLSVSHDDSYVYHLPYRPGEAFPVSQGFHGKYSHTGGDSYSIDFKMPEGTPVLAAREGVVVGVKDDSEIGGSDKKFEWDANYVLVQHSDGTLGHYVHLQKSGVRVKLGQTVAAGEMIALSGNTGHSTGPHLHFAVFRAQSGKQRETLPIKYKVSPLLADILSEGRSYRAF